MSALTRSNSLSLNTGGGGSLFGSTSTAQTGGGLFGSSNTTQSQTAGSLFSSTLKPPASSAPSTQGLFGNMTTSQPASTPSLFGNTATSQAQPTTSLFGNPSTSQPASTPSLFGSAASSQPQQASSTPTTGLFGAKPAAPAAASGGLFGSLGGANKTTTQSGTGGGLFGGTLGSTQPQQPTGTAGGLFGASTAQPKPASGGLFGSANTTTQPASLSTTGGGITGGMKLGGLGATPQQAQTVPGVQVDISNIRGTTRFSELHPSVQQDIVKIDALTAAQIKICEACESVVPSHRESLTFVPNDVEFVAAKVDAVEAALSNDAEAIAALRKIVRQDQEDAEALRSSVDMLKLPTNLQMSGLWHQYLGGQPALGIKAGNAVADAVGAGYDDGPPDLVQFFKGRADEVGKELELMQSLIGDIEAHLRLVEGRAASEAENLARRGQVQEMDSGAVVRELVQTMKGFEEAVLRVAGRVGDAREKLNEVTMEGQHSGLGGGGSSRR